MAETVWYERVYSEVPTFRVGLKFIKMSQENRSVLKEYLEICLEQRRATPLIKPQEEPPEVPEERRIIIGAPPWLTVPVAAIFVFMISGISFALWYSATHHIEPVHRERTEALWNYYAGLTSPSELIKTTGARPPKVIDKPSVAVLPLVNTSGDSGQDYFSNGVCEDVIRHLSTISDLFVTSPRSAFAYKEKGIGVRQIGSELGVRYVVAGSAERDGERVRITARMVDTETASIVWEKTHEAEQGDIAALQERIAQELAETLGIEDERLKYKPHEQEEVVNAGAYDYLLRGLDQYHLGTGEANIQARKMYGRAITQDPEYARAYALAAQTHLRDLRYGWSESPEQSLKQNVELTHKALRFEDILPEAHAVLGHIHLLRREHEKAISEGEYAAALDPNWAGAHAYQAMNLLYSGRYEEAIGGIELAMRLSPFHPPWYLTVIGCACFQTDQYEKAIKAF